jgi:hypothetical protein
MKHRKKTDAGNKTTDSGITNGSQQFGQNGARENSGSQHKEMTDPRKTSNLLFRAPPDKE